MHFLNVPKLIDVRNSLLRHISKNFPVLTLAGKTDIAIHHSLTKQNLSGSNAEGYARFHVNSNDWPGIGYHFVIEPDGTIKWCNNLELRTYHVGNSNNIAVGICLTGDFRYEEPTKEQKRSLTLLVAALKKDMPNYKRTRGHNEFPSYGWKKCPEFDFRSMINSSYPKEIVSGPVPNTYTIQEGDTFWSIANEHDDVTVADLRDVNPGVDYTQLKVGQIIHLRQAIENKPPTPTTPILTPPTIRRATVKLGDRNNDVRYVQERLNHLGFNAGATDGIFGSMTENAVVKFQTVRNLDADGIVGPKTYEELVKENTEALIGYVRIIVPALNRRQSSSFASKVTGVLRHSETKYRVREQKNGLYNLGEYDWVSAGTKFVHFEPIDRFIGEVEIATPTLNVRSSASFSSQIRRTVSKGEIIPVYEEKDGLYRIGVNEWISANSKYVTFVRR